MADISKIMGIGFITTEPPGPPGPPALYPANYNETDVGGIGAFSSGKYIKTDQGICKIDSIGIWEVAEDSSIIDLNLEFTIDSIPIRYKDEEQQYFGLWIARSANMSEYYAICGFTPGTGGVGVEAYDFSFGYIQSGEEDFERFTYEINPPYQSAISLPYSTKARIRRNANGSLTFWYWNVGNARYEFLGSTSGYTPGYNWPSGNLVVGVVCNDATCTVNMTAESINVTVGEIVIL